MLFNKNELAKAPSNQPNIAETQKPNVISAEPGLSTKERFSKAIQSLENGQTDIARAELLAYLSEIPSSETAADLLKQIDSASSDYFPEDFFTVTLKSGQSLSTLAKKYLGAPLAFYALAKYNGIENPSKVLIGSKIKIPLNNSSKLAKAEEAAMVAAKEAEELAEAKAVEVAQKPKTKVLAELSETELQNQLLEAQNANNHSKTIEIVKAMEVQGNISPQHKQTLMEALKNRAEQLATSEPQSAAALYVQLSDREMSEGNDIEAYEALKKASTINSDDTTIADKKEAIKQQVVEKYHREASNAFRQQSLEEAISKWDVVLSIDPTHANAMAYRTQALELKQKLELLKGN